MANSYLYLGASLGAVTLMPSPNSWLPSLTKTGAMNMAADGSAIFHERAQKWEWQAEWNELSYAEMTLLKTEYQRSRKIGLVAPNDGMSYTVIVNPQAFAVKMHEGTGGSADALYDVRISFREA